jgi:hypothetical protein
MMRVIFLSMVGPVILSALGRSITVTWAARIGAPSFERSPAWELSLPPQLLQQA